MVPNFFAELLIFAGQRESERVVIWEICKIIAFHSPLLSYQLISRRNNVKLDRIDILQRQRSNKPKTRYDENRMFARKKRPQQQKFAEINPNDKSCIQMQTVNNIVNEFSVTMYELTLFDAITRGNMWWLWEIVYIFSEWHKIHLLPSLVRCLLVVSLLHNMHKTTTFFHTTNTLTAISMDKPAIILYSRYILSGYSANAQRTSFHCGMM